MKDRYDVIVVGAGPAGTTAALHAASGGASVLVLERDRDIGIPVRCAEGVGEDDLRAIIEPQQHFIANRIDGVQIIAPNGIKIRVTSDKKGYILHRVLFDRYLAELAVAAGADIYTKCDVTGLHFMEDRVSGVTFESFGKKYQIKASVVIGADGVESRVGRWAGLRTQLKLKDLETCFQVTAANVAVEKNICEFYVSNEIAPMGYAWVFPKGDGLANIGLGISGEMAREFSPRYYLERFLKQKFPDASVLTVTIGGVPVARTVRPLVKRGVMLVGDAARQANPLTGGGIVNGMVGGMLAGKVVAEAVQKGDFSDQFLRRYEELWEKKEGRDHRIFYRIKSAVHRMTDDQFNRAAASLIELDPEERTVGKIFAAVLRSKPSLILDALLVFKEQVSYSFGARGAENRDS